MAKTHLVLALAVSIALASPAMAADIIAPAPGTPADFGGTIASGGMAQTALPANNGRKQAWIQNPCNATENLAVSSTGNASTTPGAGNDADLPPCGLWSTGFGPTVITGQITVNAATTAHAYIAKEVR